MRAIQDDVDGATYHANEKPGAPHGGCIGYATPKHEHSVVCDRSFMSPEVVGCGLYVLPASSMPISTGGRVMRCQHVDDDIQCRMDATRRVLVVGGDPPDPDQAGFAGTVYMVQVCKEHDPDPRQSMPLPRPPGSVPIGQRPRR